MNHENVVRRLEIRMLFAALLVAILQVAGGTAYAKSGYLGTFNSTYGTADTALNTCVLCHPTYPDSHARNAYGTAYANANRSFAAIESLDSDGDGSTNIAEINARTLPGDPSSRPAGSDTTPPAVSGTSPVGGATAVAVTANLTTTFSEAVKNVTTATFALRAGSASVAGTVTLNGTTATFDPTRPLAPSTTYTATVTTGVTDLANNALASNHSWSFTTGNAPDTTPPSVTSTTPPSGETGVAVNGAVTASFSEGVKDVNASTFTLRAGTAPVSGSVTLNGSTATFIPSTALAYSTTCTATISTAVTDLANNPLASSHSWSFTTAAAADTTPPAASATSPATGQTGVAADTAVTATFSEAMNPATLTTATFTLRSAGGAPVSGVVTSSGAAATFTPAGSLGNGVTYTATLTTGAKDLAENALAAPFSWSFTTVAASADTDGDGVENAGDMYPGDNMRATPMNPMGPGNIVIDTSGNAGTSLSMVGAVADTSPGMNQSGKPSGYEFPYGVVTYRVEHVTRGATVQVKIILPERIPAGCKVYKVDSAGFHEFGPAQLSGNAVTLTLTDGGSGDGDGQADGSILDPAGVAFPVAAGGGPSPETAADSAGGGCAVARTGADPASAAGSLVFLVLPALLLAARRAAGRGGRKG